MPECESLAYSRIFTDLFLTSEASWAWYLLPVSRMVFPQSQNYTLSSAYTIWLSFQTLILKAYVLSEWFYPTTKSTKGSYFSHHCGLRASLMQLKEGSIYFDLNFHNGKGMEAGAGWRPDQIHVNRSLYWACCYHGGLTSKDCSGSELEPQCSKPSEQPMPVSPVTYEKAPLPPKKVSPAVKQLFKQISLWDPFTFKPKLMMIVK